MVIFTKRFLLLLASGFIFAFAGYFYPLLAYGQVILYVLLVFLAIRDFSTILKSENLVITRLHGKYLSIGTGNSIKVRVENRGSTGVSLVIRDEYPAKFEVKNETMFLKVEPLHFRETHYSITPHKKGSYSFKNIHIRVIGSLGFIARQYTYKQPTEFFVYPNIIELNKTLKVLHKNRQEQLGFKKPLVGNDNEFDYLRDYQSGDEYRKINWKATSKRRYPIVEVNKREYNRNILIVLDTGRMMTTRYGNLTKLDFAIDTSLLLAAASKELKDYFGVLTFSNKVHNFLPPSKNKNILSSLLNTLYNTQPTYDKTDFYLMYRFIKQKAPKNSVIFIFTELYNKIVSEELINTLRLLTSHHKVYLISFEEIEKESKARNFVETIRWVLQQSHYVDKESIIADLGKKGVKVVRVNPRTITSSVVHAFLSS